MLLDSLTIAELFLTIAHMCRRYHILLHNTEPEDVCTTSDLLAGYTRRGVLKVHAKLKAVRE